MFRGNFSINTFRGEKLKAEEKLTYASVKKQILKKLTENNFTN